MSTFRKLVFTLTLVLTILAAQVGSVFAAPNHAEGDVSGQVTGLTCDTNPETEVTTFLVTLDGTTTVRIDQATAEALGLIAVVDGAPDCSEEALAASVGTEVTILADDILADESGEEEARHPVGEALSIFFSEITDYDTIMAAHEDGFGFGVIAQALWLTQKLEGDAELLGLILEAKQSGDFSAFVLEDGSTPTNWGQFRKAVLNRDKQNNLGVVMSEHGNGNAQNNGNHNGNGPSNAGNHGQGNGHNNGNGQGDKDKDNNGKGNDK